MGMKTPFVVLEKKHADRYHYLLWMKFLITNMLFSAVLALAFMAGWVDKALAKDPQMEWLNTLVTFNIQTSYVIVMIGVFLAGLFLCVRKAFLTSREINNLKLNNPPEFSRVAEYLDQIKGVTDSGSRAFSFRLFCGGWYGDLSTIQFLKATLVLLGLIGTVIGFIIAFSGVEPGSAGDVSAIGTTVTTLISGISLALYTTAVGAILGGLWLHANGHVLRLGSSDFTRLLGYRGEKEAALFVVNAMQKHEEE